MCIMLENLPQMSQMKILYHGHTVFKNMLNLSVRDIIYIIYHIYALYFGGKVLIHLTHILKAYNRKLVKITIIINQSRIALE